MKERKKKPISAVSAPCGRLGAQPENGGITFAAEVCGEEPASLILYHRGTQEIAAEIPFPQKPFAGDVYSMKVSGITPGAYEYNFRIGERVVTDPYARLVSGRVPFGATEERGEHQIRGGFVTGSFDWGEDRAPQIPYEDVAAYQLHVRGFTRQKNSRVRHKGTFLGIQEKIPYLKELGINQVILMPAYEFDEVMREETNGTAAVRTGGLMGDLEQNNTSRRKLNCWGYTSGFYFAPKASYSASDRPDREMKTMVKAFHENGMEVVMQFFFPQPSCVSLVNECLRWWAEEYHIDGFILLTDPQTASQAAGNPFLAGTKLMAEAFLKEAVSPEKRKGRLAECHDGFKVDARRLLKGDEDALPAFVFRTRYNPQEGGILNYVTNQDGFTLMDLVSYDKKHNEENGEQGRDGSEYNFSWNCGAEGPTRKKKIQRLRMQQMKNAFAMLLLAQGTPMIRAGDEFGNSQNGNNNPYCLDSEVSWVDWSRERSNQELTAFVKELIAFRRAHRILHMKQPLTGSDLRSVGYPDVSVHGSRAWYGEFEPVNRHVGLMYCGRYAGEDEFLYTAYNLHWEAQELALPLLPEGMEWQKVLDTAETEVEKKQEAECIGMEKTSEALADRKKKTEEMQTGTEGKSSKVQAEGNYGRTFQIGPRSIQVLVSRKTEKSRKKRNVF